jgi:FkbM family methyltransferase
MAGQGNYNRESMRGGLLHIKELGFEPRTVIDVGAALGTFELYETFPEARHLLIEPIVENEPYLAQICRKLENAEYIIAAATKEPGIVPLTVHPELVHSSLSDKSATSDENLYTRTIPAITLDQICRERKLKAPYLIKIDIDGKEVDVLAGATQILKETEYVIVEVSLFAQIYDVMNFLKTQGFTVYDMVDLARRPLDNALWQCNMAFVKESGQFRTSSSYVNKEQEKKLSNYLKIYREKTIDYIEKYYSDENQKIQSQEIALNKDLNLRDINLIIFPDWSQSEDLLFQDLVNLLRVVAKHPDKSNMTLLVDTSNIADEEAELAISGIVMNLLMEEELDLEEGPEILLIGKLSERQWSELLPRIHARIVLEYENQQALGQARVQTIPFYELDSFSDTQTGSCFNLSNKLFREGRWQEAIDQYQKILKTQTGDAELYWQLSESYRQLNLLNEAFSALREGIRLYPTDARLHFSLIVNLQGSGRIQEAMSSADTAASLLPNDYTFKILKNLLVPIVYETHNEIDFYRQRFTRGLQNLIQQTSLETTEEQMQALSGIGRLTNFYISYQAQNDRELQCQYGNLVHKIMAANYPKWVAPLSMPPLKENNKIRVGYVSAYLHSYSGTLWLTGWLRYCDRQNFEIYCYYTGDESDPITQQFQNYSDVFYHIPHNLEAACEQIIADQLHILVFPEIGMNSQIMQMAGLRLAPVQCVAWGHPVTSGLPTIDYFLSGELMEPDNAQQHYSERLIRLPNIGVSYPKPYIPPLTKTRGDFQLEDDAVIYLCCQAPYKYLPQYDFIFAEIARRFPKAQFVFLRGGLLKQRLSRAFAAAGLKSENYCVFLTIPERLEYLTLNLLSDVYLDTFTWSGGNTTLEAIACNLPIVTCPGEFMRGRHSYSFLSMIEVTETIAQNEMEYIEIAVKLGLDPEWRRNILERIKERHDRLYDDKACVAGLEAFYKQVVRERLIQSRDTLD